MLVNVCGWEGAILLQVLHKSRVASMSADSPGQWTMPRALFFIETTPWCPPWSSWSTLFRRGRGMTILSLDMITPSLLYSEWRSPKNWAVAVQQRRGDHVQRQNRHATPTPEKSASTTPWRAPGCCLDEKQSPRHSPLARTVHRHRRHTRLMRHLQQDCALPTPNVHQQLSLPFHAV